MDALQIEPVARFQKLLRSMQMVCFELKTARPKLQPSGVYSNLTEFRNKLYDRMIGLYKEADDAFSVLEYDLLLRPLENYEQVKYEVDYMKERYTDIKVEFREAQLKSKTLERVTIKEDIERRLREETASADSKDAAKQTETKTADSFLDEKKLKELTKQDRLLDKNKQITSKLQNITSIMHDSVLSGEKNLQDLSSSTSSMAYLSSKYGHFADVLVKTNGLVKTINESSDAERRQIYRSIYFFIFVCCYIVYKRILRRPVRLFLWLFFNFFKYTILGGKTIRGSLAGSREETILGSITASISATNTIAGASAVDSLNETISALTESVSSISRDEL